MEFTVPSSTVADLPESVLICTTDVCNLACVQCPHVDPNNRWSHSEVPGYRLVQATNKAKLVSLHGAGEVLTHPRWTEFVPKNPDCDSGFVTNGILIGRNVDKILRSGIKWLDISVDAGSAEAYYKVRGADWDTLWEGVDKLIAKRGDGPPRLCANVCMMRETLREPAKLVQILADRNFDRLHVYHLNYMDEVLGKQWSYRFHDGSPFVYWDQQFKPEHLQEHDHEMTLLAAVARYFDFDVRVSGTFFGHQTSHTSIQSLVYG